MQQSRTKIQIEMEIQTEINEYFDNFGLANEFETICSVYGIHTTGRFNRIL